MQLPGIKNYNGDDKMRTEQEMLNLILSIAKNDEQIHAVYMNGSRTNPNADKDIFQDYDIAYVVDETKLRQITV